MYTKITTLVFCFFCSLLLSGCGQKAYIEIRDAETHEPFTQGYVMYRTIGYTLIKHKAKAKDGRYCIRLYDGDVVFAVLEVPELNISLGLVSGIFKDTEWQINKRHSMKKSQYLEDHPIEIKYTVEK